MTTNFNKSLLTDIERKLRIYEAGKSSVWFQTVGGNMVELESDLSWFSDVICVNLIDFGVGYTRDNPICLPPRIAPEALESVFDYFRFYQEPGRSDEECNLFADEFLEKDTRTLCMMGHAAKYLQVEGVLDMICEALAHNIDNNTPKVNQDFMKYFEKHAEGGELEPPKNLNGDLRVRLSYKLLAKQKKEHKEVEKVKEAEAEVKAQKHENRSIDDLVSFINGGVEDTKAVQTLKKKKKKKKNGNKVKDKNKTSSCSVFSSPEAPALKNVSEKREEGMHASASSNPSGSSADSSSKLLGIQEESFNVEGDVVDNDMDSEKIKEIDREVEEFARLLNLDPATIV